MKHMCLSNFDQNSSCKGLGKERSACKRRDFFRKNGVGGLCFFGKNGVEKLGTLP